MRTRLAIVSAVLSGAGAMLLTAVAGARPAEPPEPAPPANQTFIGVTKCASCHFDKFSDWRKSQEKHAKAFEILPAASQADPACLKCHTTGFGQPGGYAAATDRSLAGITCESCHGPGSAHAEIAKPYAQKKKPLPPEEDKIARDSIYKMLPENVCVTCHSARAHKKHPEYPK